MKRACWAFVIALGIAMPAAAAPPGTVRFRSFGSPEGLHNLVVVSITQDASGLLWLATDDGVYRYDGERFTHLGGADGLPSTTVLVVGVGPDGNACAGTANGLVCWDGARFAPQPGLPVEAAQTMVVLRDRLWVGTAGGLYVGGKTGSFMRAPGWPGTGEVKALFADPRGLIAAAGGRVWLTAGDGAWHELAGIGLAGDRIDGLLRDRSGAIWIRTALHMWRLAPGQARADDVGDGLPSGYDSVGVATAMLEGPDGDVWVGTDVGIAQRRDNAWTLLDRSAGLPTHGARTLFVDRDRTVWVGSIGLFELRGRGLVERHDLASGLPGDVAWSFARDRDGTLWVGTSHCLARQVHDSWVCLPGTENRVVRSFVFPPQGGVFLGGAPGDLLYIDPDGRSQAITVEPTAAGDHLVLALAVGPEGDLWIATRLALYRMAGAIPGPVERIAVPGVRTEARFSSLVVADGRLWSATPDGIVVGDHGTWHLFDTRDGFRANAMRYLVHRRDGRMCVAYTEAIGVTCFATDGKSVAGLEHIADELTSGMVYFLGEDAARRLWIGTGDGVDVVTPQGIDHFSEADGLAGDDSAGTAYFNDRDGSVWLGATGGASHVHAERYAGPPHPPQVVVRSGHLGEQPLRNGMVTTHRDNALAIQFSSDTLVDPRRIEYQVRLLPLEHEWSTSHFHESRYPALAGGEYTLELRARIGAGTWGPVTRFDFAVRPAWWQTGWFFVAVCVAALLALAGCFAMRQRVVLAREARRHNEQAAESLRQLLELVPDLITVYREDKLIYMNHTARQLFGVGVATAAEFAERVHPEDRAQRAAMFERALEAAPGSAPAIHEIRARGGDGTMRICEVSCARIELGGSPALVVSGRDVTERNRLRSQVLISDRMASLGTLAAGIAHEINNPLAYVMGNLELMADGVASGKPEGLATAIRDATDGAQRVRTIVQGLRSFSRSEEEKRAPLELRDVLDVTLRLTANEVRHRAELAVEFGTTPRVVADAGRLTQVFINLVVNAAQAIPEGRSAANKITVRTLTGADGRAIVEIADTGRGMTPEVAARAFDPFFTTKAVGSGTGLGLAICHGIITSLGGAIAIESVVDKGTTVRVVLPAAPAVAPVAAAPEPAAPVARESRRVMIVDDDVRVGETIARLLRRDHEVVVASCGEEALRHIETGQWFDAIISDVMMPNMTGIELLERLVAIAPAQSRRLMFLSGGVFAAETRARLEQLGTLQLDKPVNGRDLRAAVANVVATPRS